MPAYQFNAAQYEPSYGGAAKMFQPCKKAKVIIAESTMEPTKDGKGGFLAFLLRCVEGPMTGKEHTDRLNLHNQNPKTVEIANGQLSAYCHVLGRFAFQATEELHNIPFLVDVDWQKGNEPSAEKPEGGFTQVTAVYDVNGNAPGKAGQGKPVAAAPVAVPVAAPAVAPAAPLPAAWQQKDAAPANNGAWGNR